MSLGILIHRLARNERGALLYRGIQGVFFSGLSFLLVIVGFGRFAGVPFPRWYSALEVGLLLIVITFQVWGLWKLHQARRKTWDLLGWVALFLQVMGILGITWSIAWMTSSAERYFEIL